MGIIPGGQMRRSRIITLLLVAALFAACPRAGDAQPAGLRDVSDPGGRFSISVPADWKIEMNPDGPANVVAATPSNGSDVPLKVNIVVSALGAPLSPEELGKRSGAELRPLYRQFTVVQEGPAQIGGRTVYYLDPA